MARRFAFTSVLGVLLVIGCAPDRDVAGDDLLGGVGPGPDGETGDDGDGDPGTEDGGDDGGPGGDDGGGDGGDGGDDGGTEGGDDGGADPPDTGDCTWTPHQKGSSSHALQKSSYELHVPSSYDPATPMPLVIALHGTGGSGPEYMGSCGWQQTAESKGFIVAAPSAWSASKQFLYDCCNASCTDICQADGEEDFMWALIDEIAACYNIDESRLYMFGFSQGGFFSTFFCLKHETQMTACGAHGAGCYSGGAGGHCDLIAMGDQPRKVPFYVYAGTSDEYHDGATDLAGLLAKHGYPHELVEPPGLGHWCDPNAVAPQWDWWAQQGSL